jgi:hypothetical protein
VLAVLVAEMRRKVTRKRATVGDDVYVTTRDDFEDIRVNETANGDLDVELFNELSRQGLHVLLARVGSTAGQFPFIARVLDQDNLSVE